MVDLLNFPQSISNDIFWQDESHTYTYQQVKALAIDHRSLWGEHPKGAICALIGFSPLETWVLMLAAWQRGLCVLPFAERTLPAAIELALNQIPWTLRCEKSPAGDCSQTNSGAISLRVTPNPQGATATESQVLIMTSGSTGGPKAIAHTLSSLSASARATLAFYEWKKGDSWLLSLDPSHIGGFQILLRVWLGQGLCYYGGEPKDLAQALSVRSFSFLSLVPTQIFRLLEDTTTEHNLRAAKAILLGGAATQGSLLERLRALNLPVSITFGASEAASQISAFSPGVLPTTIKHVGRLLEIWTLEAGPDEQLFLSGPALMLGYWQHKKWHELNGSPYLLSDRGRLENGVLTIEGRADQVFQVGGENLAPQEILGLLESFYLLADLALIAKPDLVFGFVPQLIIRSRTKPSINDLFARFESLLPMKRPREIWWLETDEVSKLSKANLEHLLREGSPLLHRLWIYEKI
ncbi:MAG: AMP-binding protein [Chitinophagaceae bacterium]|nr:AMP-binding protein [Oligoflexus sp.]